MVDVQMTAFDCIGAHLADIRMAGELALESLRGEARMHSREGPPALAWIYDQSASMVTPCPGLLSF